MAVLVVPFSAGLHRAENNNRIEFLDFGVVCQGIMSLQSYLVDGV